MPAVQPRRAVEPAGGSTVSPSAGPELQHPDEARRSVQEEVTGCSPQAGDQVDKSTKARQAGPPQRGEIAGHVQPEDESGQPLRQGGAGGDQSLMQVGTGLAGPQVVGDHLGLVVVQAVEGVPAQRLEDLRHGAGVERRARRAGGVRRPTGAPPPRGGPLTASSAASVPSTTAAGALRGESCSKRAVYRRGGRHGLRQVRERPVSAACGPVSSSRSPLPASG